MEGALHAIAASGGAGIPTVKPWNMETVFAKLDAVKEGYRDGILEQQPTLVNLQCDVDHPTQCMACLLYTSVYLALYVCHPFS